MFMENLTIGERSAIIDIIGEVDNLERGRILNDLSISRIDVMKDDRSIIEFNIPGYERPPTRSGQRALEPEGEVEDEDGEILSVVLYVDRNGRLLEFELVRFGEGAVQGARWETFRVGRTDD